MKRKMTIWTVILTLFMIFASISPAFAASEYDSSKATYFTFSSSGIAVKEGSYTGYKVEGTALTITSSGTYVVSGSCSDGSIAVKKGTTGVTLVLNGLTLTSQTTAPICCNKSTEVNIIAAAGTKNTLSDTKYNNDETYSDNELAENAVIKCKDGSNVTISGSGTLTVNSNGKNGIKGGADLYEEDSNGNSTGTLLSEASLTVKDLTLNITASAGDGLKSDKVLDILSGTITVSADDDAVKCDYVLNIGSKSSAGPTINITKSAEGIEGAVINVYSGTVTFNATDDGINAANSDLGSYSFAYNQYGGYVWVNVTNGDAVDSNGTINLYGGTLESYAPSQGDGDPLDAERGTTFAGATVLAAGHAGMMQQYSAQTPYVIFSGNSLASSGSTITVKDPSGNTLYTAKAVRSLSYIVFSSDDLKSGETYTLYSGGSAVASATAGIQSSGGMGGPGMNGHGMNGQGGYGPGMNGQGGHGPGMNGQNSQGAYGPGMNGVPQDQSQEGMMPGQDGQTSDGMTPPEGEFPGTEGFPDGEDASAGTEEGTHAEEAEEQGLFQSFILWLKRIFGITD